MHGFAYPPYLSRFLLLCLAPCCTVLRSGSCHSGVRRRWIKSRRFLLKQIRDHCSITLFTEALGSGVLRSAHSPGPTLMSILYLDRHPSRVTLRRHAPPHRRRLQKGVTLVGLDSLVAGSASGYMVRSLQLYIRERRRLATHLRCRRTRR